MISYFTFESFFKHSIHLMISLKEIIFKIDDEKFFDTDDFTHQYYETGKSGIVDDHISIGMDLDKSAHI
jgi:hypothetical protein